MPGVNCPHCGLAMPIIQELIGRQVRCPECNGVFQMLTYIDSGQPNRSIRSYSTRRTASGPIDNRLLLGITFGGISAIAGGLGILMTTMFGIAWWALVAGSFALAGLVFTLSTKWRSESVIAFALSAIGATAAIYLAVAGMSFRHI